MLWIQSGVTTRRVGFRRQAGLTGFTVYRSRNGGAAAAMSSPTVTERAVADSESIYWLLLDEDMTVGAGNGTEHMIFQVTASGMQTAVLEVMLYDPQYFKVNAQYMNSGQIYGDGTAENKWRGAGV